jgi:hypothetical protein
VPAGRARPPVPGARSVDTTLTLPAGLLVEALQALAGAATRNDVAEAVCAALVELDGVRAVAVLQRERDQAVVVGSSGYNCDAMAPGARLPLDSGLPATEAIRTARRVSQGDGPGWCALPFGRRATSRGVLLLSLGVGPPQDLADLAVLDRLAAALGIALDRAHSADRAAVDLAGVVAGLAPRRSVEGILGVAVRQEPRGGSLGGDVVMTVPDGRGGEWLLAADVCGSGLAAATGAAAVRIAIRAVASLATGPAQLLGLLDGALRPEAPAGGFITAVVVHVAYGTVRAASAGHPAPLLITATGTVELGVEPGPPLALETTERLPVLRELTTVVEPGALLVLYTDGLTDRHGAEGGEIDVRRLAATAAGARSPAHAALAIVDAAEAEGPAEDDVSVLVARLPG